MLFQGKDGELRISDQGLSGTTYYLEILFCEMNMSGPIKRARTEEKLIMNRGKMDTDAHFVQGNDDPIYAPLSLTFSCKLGDVSSTTAVLDMMSGSTSVHGKTLYSRDGYAVISANTVPAFADSGKTAYRVEVIWDGTVDLGVQWDSVYFPPNEQTIAESADGLTLSCNGKVYGGVSRIEAFTAGYTNVML